MDYTSLNEFEKTNDYVNFKNDNPKNGILKAQVFTADQAIPIANTKIYISKNINGKDVLFFEGITDSSGIISNINLPAPGGEYNLETYEVPKYTTYDLVAVNDKYSSDKKYEVAMFGDVKVIQYIKMLPKMSGEN